MRKIGEGWQCTVYDLEDGRVLKKEKTLFSRFLTILLRGGPQEIIKGEVVRAGKDYRTSLSGLTEKLKSENIDPALFGNPTIDLGTFSYTQDKVIPLNKLLAGSSTQRVKELFDQYIVLLKKLWSLGIYEEVFNFSLNFGLNPSGSMVLTDLGELQFEKSDKILAAIASKRWLRAYSYFTLKNEVAKAYYKEKMNAELTVDEFNRLWKSFS
jgi:hypothetical protein